MADNDDDSNDEAFFYSIPGFAAMLAEPDFEIVPSPPRTAKDDAEGSLIDQTLRTPRTIQAMMTLAARPVAAPPGIGIDGATRIIPEIRILVSLGEGLNGPFRMLHGGISVLLLDQAMGWCFARNVALQPSTAGVRAATGRVSAEYLAPVRTPGVYVVRVRLRDWRQRRMTMEAWLEDGDEGC